MKPIWHCAVELARASTAGTQRGDSAAGRREGWWHGRVVARVVLATIVLVARVPGWLYQEPLAPPVFVLGGFAMLAYLTARARDA